MHQFYILQKYVNFKRIPNSYFHYFSCFFALIIFILLNEFLELGWKKPTIVYYIDSEKIDNKVLEKLPIVAGAAFVKESYFDMGLVVSHEGVIIDKSEIIHASSEFGKTVKMDFLEYLLPKGKPRFDGVIFFSF